jgi:pimeloyl-[acyl-carrier protein] methyl ester esterase
MPVAAAEALAVSLPNAQLEVFADCAHAPFTSQPDEFIARVHQFLHD